ncbi:MAG: UDP-N-acetylmuramoyl-L-alanyl-D-glutamate--2,6-diaminopimelate ligase [Planctomycetota bacterium]|jgi:UDP-N-acetylmuramoyl-L-alanyl-D-glutamate--2,6-diaminopimelate ligase|nr:UDP-N-acetylmuramoyl-L-alanyl-D-glutamate--2,6-diaminopimelate ligase [Planctomycetota bacterium]
MLLAELAKAVGGAELAGRGNPEIRAIVQDSREALPGCLFAALPGAAADGLDFVDDALRRGAAALLLPRFPESDPGVPVLAAADVRKALGEAADAFYQYPSRNLELIGVTGTNGKTTSAYLIRHILNSAGRRAGMIGTVEYDLGGKLEPAPLTTPGTVRFTRSLAEMRRAGCRAAVAEVSSHALSQDRVWPHRFAAAVFTNLTRDHLDYHGGMDSYRESKRLLFSRLDPGAMAVFNLGDSASPRLAEGCRARLAGYSRAGGKPAAGGGDGRFPGEVFLAETVASGLEGQSFDLSGPGLNRRFHIPLVGRHNLENSLGAILAARGLGVSANLIREALADFPGVPGRLERIQSPSGVTAFVDYAHTDDALRSVLSVLRPLTPGRLITVFGCGGNRDRGKRPLMARAAEDFSDRVVVTSDNPRLEDPGAIIKDIMGGFARPDGVAVEPDRERAVFRAAGMAEPGDAILVAGKGHENYQILGTEKRRLDDRELVRNAFLA